jgi:hypothetical protein
MDLLRPSLVLTCWLSLHLTLSSVSAQASETDRLSLQIQSQENAVKRDPGKHDGRAWLQLAVLHQNAADYKDSEQAYQQAISLLKPKDQSLLADAQDQLATLYIESGKLSKAEPLERKSLAIREKLNEHTKAGLSHTHLSALLLGQGKLSLAEAEANLAAQLLVPAPGALSLHSAGTPEEQMSALINLALVRCAHQACRTAIPDLQRALEIAHATYPENSIPVGYLNFLLGQAFWKSGDVNAARPLMTAGIQELSTQLAWGHPIYLRALQQYKDLLQQIGNAAEARAIELKIAKLGNSRWLVSANRQIGLAQLH